MEVPWGPGRINIGDEVSQMVYPRASKVVRIPPLGKDEASGSDWRSWNPEKRSMGEFCGGKMEKIRVREANLEMILKWD